jgi:flavodoxin
MEATMELNAQSGQGSQKILVVYFSWGGNTRTIAQQIHQRVGGDICFYNAFYSKIIGTKKTEGVMEYE